MIAEEILRLSRTEGKPFIFGYRAAVELGSELIVDGENQYHGICNGAVKIKDYGWQRCHAELVSTEGLMCKAVKYIMKPGIEMFR